MRLEMQTRFKQLVVRLRREGGAVVMSLPLSIREKLALKSGDVVAISAVNGNVIARKLDLKPITERLERDGRKPRGN